MAITRAQIKAAVEQYLPKTVNFARSEDLGTKDPDAIFSRLLQVVLTALLLDESSVLAISYQATQRLLTALDSGISLLTQLRSEDVLRSIESTDPTPVSSLQSLQESRLDLLRISGSIADSGTFNTGAFDSFKTNITDFLTDEIKPNVAGRNKVAISNDINLIMASLVTAWELVRTRRAAALAVVPNYISSDVRSTVAATVLASINDQLDELEEELATQTTAEQAAAAEQTMIDLAAAQAALELVGTAPTVASTTSAGPGADGFTESTYLLLEGAADTQAQIDLESGTAGQLVFPFALNVSNGSATDDLDSDNLTPIFTDAGGTFQTLGVTADENFITILSTGRTHRVTQVVSETEVRLDPEISTSISNEEYLISGRVPGTYFRDSTKSFWTEYTTAGATPTNNLATGTQGQFLARTVSSGTGGTNVKDTGTDGEGNPLQFTQTDGDTDPAGDFSSAAATWLTNGIEGAANWELYITEAGANNGFQSTITTVTSQTELTVTSNFPDDAATNVDYGILGPDGDSLFRSGTATFLANGVSAGDELKVIVTGPGLQTYSIDSVTSDTLLYVTTSPFTSLTNSQVWWVPLDSGDDVFEDKDATFISDGVQAGDTLNLTIGLNDYTLTVNSVLSQTQLQINSDWTTELTLETNPIFEAETWSIVAAGNTTRFSQADAVNFTVVADPGDILIFDSVNYTVGSVDSAAELTTLSDRAASSQLAWTLVSSLTTSVFQDSTNSPFTANSVGSEIILNPGTPQEERHNIVTFNSASEVVVSGTLDRALTGITYAVTDIVDSRKVLIAAGRRAPIVRVLDVNTLELLPPLSGVVGTNVSYQIVNPRSPQRTNRLIDRALVSGFPSTVVGSQILVGTERPRTGTVLSRVDLDLDTTFESIDLDFTVPTGLRGVQYQLLIQPQGTTKTFKATTTDITSSVVAGDWLTIWADNNVYDVTQVDEFDFNVEEPLEADLSGLDFIVTRGGAQDYGRFVLLETLDSALSLSADTSALRLRVAEVLIDFGATVLSELVNVPSGSTAVLDDPDLDGSSTQLSDASTDFVAAGVLVGDRLVVNAQSFVYIDSVSTNAVTFSPALTTESVTSFVIDRTSVSGALRVAADLQAELQALRDLFSAYFIQRNATIEGVIDVLEDQGQDRAIELLLSGDIQGFIALQTGEGNYVSFARSKTTSAAQRTSTSSLQQRNMARAGSGLGGSSSSGTSNAVTSYGQPLSQEVNTIVELAKGTEALVGDERVSSAVEIGLEEVVNRAIYELTGEIRSTVITDTDPTLPWLAQTGSVRERVVRRAESLKAALQYMIDHPDEFDEAFTEESSS